MQSLHQKLRAMRAAFAARSGDFPALARAFVNAYELQVQNANKRLANVEAMLAEGRYDEADALMLDEPPLLELCEGLRQIEADKQGVLNVCKVGLKRVVDAKLLERVKSASGARARRPTVATPPPLPSSVHTPPKRVNAIASPHVRSPKYLVPVSIGIGVFGVLCLIVSLVVFSLNSTVDPAVLASLEMPASPIPAVDQARQSDQIDQDDSPQNGNELNEATDAETDPAIVLPDGSPVTEGTGEPTNASDSFLDAIHDKVNTKEATEPTRTVLVGQIQAAKLLKGEVCVRLEIEKFTNLPLGDVRYSHEQDGRAFVFSGALNAERRPANIKHIECTQPPFKLVVEVENKNKELKERASKIRTTWGSITKAIVGWQNALRKSGFTRSQAIELLIEKPEEPKVNASVPDLQKQLVELSERTEQVLEGIAEHEAELTKKNTPEEAAAHFQVHTAGLNKFQELLASLRRDIEDLANVDVEFDTGTIMYIGRVEGGELVDATELRATYVIGQAN